jgi:hypothetical protein
MRWTLFHGVNNAEYTKVLSEGVSRKMIELVQAGRSPRELEKKFEPIYKTIQNWVCQGRPR